MQKFGSEAKSLQGSRTTCETWSNMADGFSWGKKHYEIKKNASVLEFSKYIFLTFNGNTFKIIL